MKKTLILIALLLFAPLAMAQDRLLIDGTGDSQLLLRKLATAFEQANPGTQVVVPDSVGSSGGVRALIKGKCDLARVARPLKGREKKQAADLVNRIFAYSPVVFTANLTEPCISDLSAAQAAGIFSGTIKDWSEFKGCQKQKIYVASREEGDSSRSVLEKNISEFKAIPQFAGKTVYSTPETIQIIKEHPFTIGYLPQAMVAASLTTFSFNGVPASEANVQNGAYPLVSPFGLVWRGELSGLAARFVDFVASPAGHKIIRSAGAVPAVAERLAKQ